MKIQKISTTPFFKFNNNNKHSIDSAIKVILHLLGKISNDRKEIIENEIVTLFENFNDNKVIQKIIKEKIAYARGLI